VAIDPRKLLLAAFGILAMSLGWWVWGLSFQYQYLKEPTLSDYPENQYTERYGEMAEARRQADLSEDRARWKLMRDIAGKGAPLSTMPWDENRGPNPYLLATGQAGQVWEKGGFWDWLLKTEVPVLYEPLFKFLRPVVVFFKPNKNGWDVLYLLGVILWTLAVWSLFGGAISRMAVVEVTRKEKVGLGEALRYSWRRWRSFLCAPLFPLILVAILAVLMIAFGAINLIPLLGDVWDGLLWWLPLLGGLVMAVTLIGLVGWPLMTATVSAEGADAWEAVSRSYSYVYSAPRHFIWYNLVAMAYGAVVVFFVGFIGSMTVYLAGWGVSQTPFSTKLNRDPAFLFVYAPQSFGWRTLLLDGTRVKIKNKDTGKTEIRDLVVTRVVGKGTPAEHEVREIDEATYNDYVQDFEWYNYFGVIPVTGWLWLVFLLVLGFGYSYFWTAGSIIYLLLRKKVDDADLDEVYLEEEEQETMAYEPASKPVPPPAAPQAIQLGTSLLRKSEAVTPTTPPPPAADTGGAPVPEPVPAPPPPSPEPPPGGTDNPPAGGAS
jgi:hypothetical protein